MFWTCVIKVDKREVLALYFKHNHVLLLFLGFPGKLPLFGQCGEFLVISIMTPPGRGQFDMSSKLILQKYLDYL